MSIEADLKAISEGVKTLLLDSGNSTSIPPYLLSVKISVTEFAQATEVHAETVKRRIKKGKIKADRTGKNYLIPITELIKAKGNV